MKMQRKMTDWLDDFEDAGVCEVDGDLSDYQFLFPDDSKRVLLFESPSRKLKVNSESPSTMSGVSEKHSA